MAFFSKKFIKAPVAVLLIVCFVFQFIPAPRKAEAYSLYDLRVDIQRAIANVIPEIVFAKKPSHPKTDVEKHFTWAILGGWENPFNNISFREGQETELPAKDVQGFSITFPHPFYYAFNFLDQTFSLGKKVISATGLFKPLDTETANKTVSPEIHPLCQAKIPALTEQTNSTISQFCEQECLNMANEEEEAKCKRDCPVEQRRRIQQACGLLRQIQKAAARQAQLAKQIYINTDPLSTCLFLRTCRSSCQLSLGGLEIEINIIETIASIFLLFFGDSSQLVHLIEIAKQAKDLVEILEKAKAGYEAILFFIAAIYNLLEDGIQVVHGVVNVLDVIMNGALANPLNWQVWKEFADNFGRFIMEKANALARLDSAGAKLTDIAEEIEEKAGFGSDQWLKLFVIRDDYIKSIIEFATFGGGKSYSSVINITDFITKPLKAIEDYMEDDVEDFIEDKFSEGHQEEVEDFLEDIQEAIYNIRGIEPTSGGNWKVINKASDTSLAAKGIYGIKQVWRTPKAELGFLPSRFSYLGSFVYKLDRTKDKSRDMLGQIDGRNDSYAIGILETIERLESRADAYCGGAVGLTSEEISDCQDTCNDNNQACDQAFDNCEDYCESKPIYGRMDCYYACDRFPWESDSGRADGDKARDQCEKICRSYGIGSNETNCKDSCDKGRIRCELNCRDECGECNGDTLNSCKNLCNNSGEPCDNAGDACKDYCSEIIEPGVNRFRSREVCEFFPWEDVNEECSDYFRDNHDGECSVGQCDDVGYCQDACREAEARGDDSCQNMCESICEVNCGTGGGGDCLEQEFLDLLRPIKEAAEKIRDEYVGEWGDNDECAFNSDVCQQFSYEQFFEQEQKVGAFLSDLRCFEEKFYNESNYCFFDKARVWLSILEKLTFIDGQLFVAKENLIQLQPMLDVPPGKDMADRMDFSDIFKSPFDYINYFIAAIHRACVRAVDTIRELEKVKYNEYIDSSIAADLKELRENYIGEGIQVGFSGLDQLLYIIATEQEETVPAQAAVFSGVLEEGRHLDKLDIDPEDIFGAYGFEVPGWYNDFIVLMTKLRKAQYGLRDILNSKIEIQRVAQYFFDSKAKLEYLQPDLFGPRAELLAFPTQQLVGNVLVLKRQIISTFELFNEIFAISSHLTNNPSNPFNGFDLGDVAGIPADYCQTRCQAVCLGETEGQCFELCYDKCAEANVGARAYYAAKIIREVDWRALFAAIKQRVAGPGIDNLNKELLDARIRVNTIIILVDNLIEYEQSIEEVSYEETLRILLEEIRTPGRYGELRAEDLIDKFADIVETIRQGITMESILQSIIIGAEKGSFLDISNKVEQYLKRIMDVLGVIIGIRSAWYDVGKTSQQLGPDWQVLAEAWKKVKESAKDLKRVYNEASDKTIKDLEVKSFGLSTKWEGVQCKSTPARGTSRTTGPTGGQVCPNVDRLTRQLNSQFTSTQTALRQLQIIRRAPISIDLSLFQAGEEEVQFTKENGSKTSLKWSDIDIHFVNIYKVNEPDELNIIYSQASDIVDESRDLWGLNTAIDFANKECTCGQSYCVMPICISELPLTPQALTNAYCWIVYILRGWLWSKARGLENYLMEEVIDDQATGREVIDSFVPEGASPPYEANP